MRRLVLLATLLGALILPGVARAAAVRLDTDPGDGRTPPSQNLVYTAGPGEANRLTIRYDGASFFVDDVVPIALGLGCRRPVAGDTTRARCDGDAGGDAEVALGDGNDRARATGGDLVASVDAGPGDDVVRAATVLGGPGADRIVGRDLTGGPGDDVELAEAADGPSATFHQGTVPDGADLLVGADAGEDTVDYGDRTAPVRVSLDGRANDGAPGEGDDLRSIEDITGGRAADVLTGDDRPNLIDGGPGGDTIRGRGGDDKLFGGFFDSGPIGNDTIDGGRGDDFLAGSRGNDLLIPGPGADDVDGATGDDRIRARDASIDAVACGPGRDRVTLNRLDYVSAEGGRCDRIFRTGVPAPVPLGISTFNQSDAVSAIVGCPADLHRRCAGRVRARLGGRSFVRRFSAKPGRRVYVTLGDSRDKIFYPAFGQRVRTTVRAKDRRGVVRVVSRSLAAGIDE